MKRPDKESFTVKKITGDANDVPQIQKNIIYLFNKLDTMFIFI